jgi:hypothetical protein
MALCLSPQQFASRFKPTEYEEDWEGVKDVSLNELPSASGHKYDHAALVADVKEHGVREPVEVSKGGWVENGHHRVIAAIDARADIPYKYVPRAHDEDYY